MPGLFVVSATSDFPPISPRGLEVLNRDDPHSIRSYLSEERLREFHNNRRILVVDDVAATVNRIADSLAPLYATVDREIDALEALRRIRSAEDRGEPYDAIVVDLFMPAMLGSELVRQLGSSPPAVVINTASMMGPVLADIRLQIDSYTSGNSELLFDAYRSAREQQGLPTVAILSHHKLEDLMSLVDEIDSAMLIRTFAADSTARFLTAYHPRLKEISFTEETVHRFCEDLRVFVETMESVSSNLQRSSFPESDWWGRNGGAYLTAMTRLRNARYSNTFAETPTLTASNLHALIGQFFLAGPPAVKDATDILSAEAVHHWREAWNAAREGLNSGYKNFERHLRGELDLQELVRSVCPECRLAESEPDSPGTSKKALVMDPERFLRVFVTSLLDVHRARVGSYDQGGTDVYLAFHPESDQYSRHTPEELVRRFHDIHCGDYYCLSLHDQVKRPLDADFQAVLPQLAMFQRSRQGFFEVFQDEWGTQVNIYFKVSEKTQDFLAEIARKKDRALKKPDGTWLLDSYLEIEIPVHENLGKKGDIVVLGGLPADLYNGARPMLYQAENLRILASEWSHGWHVSASGVIGEFLREFLSRKGDPRAAEYEPSQKMSEIHYDGVRLKVEGGVMLLDARKDKSNWAYKTLRELGVPKSRIKFSPESFVRL